jgi:hypothetical protein
MATPADPKLTNLPLLATYYAISESPLPLGSILVTQAEPSIPMEISVAPTSDPTSAKTPLVYCRTFPESSTIQIFSR